MKSSILITLLFGLLSLAGVALADLKGGIPATLPNLHVNEQHQVVGSLIDVQFLQCFYKDLKQSVSWESYPTARLIQRIKNNKLDIIFPMGFTPERQAQLIQSVAVQGTRDYWVYTHDQPNLSDKSLTVGVKLGSPQASYVQGQDYENIVFHNDYAGLLSMLLAGRVQMIALPDIVYNASASRYPDNAFKFSVYIERGYGFYMKPTTAPAQVARINQAVIACRSKLE